MDTPVLRVGACQTPEILADVDSALDCMETFAAHADSQGVELLLFPECFLQGYLVEEPHLHQQAMGRPASSTLVPRSWPRCRL